MVRKFIISIGLIAVVLAVAVGVSRWLIVNRPQPQREARGARAPLVTTVILTPEDARETLFGYGTARSDQRATLTAEVSAPVRELVGGLQEGMAAGRDQLLVRLDDRQYRQELHEAQAMLQARGAELAQVSVERRNFGSLLEIADADVVLNRDERERVQKLYDAGNAPKKEFDDARLRYQASLRAKQLSENQIALLEPKRLRLEAEKSAATARAERAELNIERCRITAPFAGRIESLSVEIGDKVRLGSEILKLVNLDRIEVPVELPVSKRPRTSTGAGVVLHVESMPDVRWRGLVSRMAPVADARSRTFEVYVEVDNREQAIPLLPGYFVKAEVEGPIIADALIVPRSAVVASQVFVANNNEAHPVAVHVERYLGDRAVLSGDVRPGDRVITTNLDMLYEGAAVRVEGEVAGADETTEPVGAGAGVATSTAAEDAS